MEYKFNYNNGLYLVSDRRPSVPRPMCRVMATTISDVSRKAVQARHCFVAKKRHIINAMIYIDIFNRTDLLKAGLLPLA